MEWYSILSIIFSINGILLFGYGIHVVKRMLRLFPKAKIMRYWRIILIFVVFFIFGYLTNIIALIFDIEPLIHSMTGFIYLTGAVFVVGVIMVSHLTYTLIKNSYEEQSQDK